MMIEDTFDEGAVKIEDWSFTGGFFKDKNGILKGFLQIVGKTYGHPIIKDGQVMISSMVDEMDLRARRARTKSGRKYILGKVHPDYVEWLKKNGMEDTLNKLFPILN